MCGIAGMASIGGSPVDPNAIKRMCDAIAHRGPDDAGYAFFRLGKEKTGEGGGWSDFADPAFRHLNERLPVYGGQYYQDEISRGGMAVAMGHRRLSIIDLSSYGHQPMSSSDRRYWVVFNGEIYNFPELREELCRKNHIFLTKSDTEVLLHLWEEHRTDCLPMLNGMFAFAIYDRVKNVITLARDRFGVKPLYYANVNGWLIFASEIKAILASGLITPSINPRSLVEYFTFQNTFGRETLFEGVHILQPGEFLKLSPDTEASPRPQRYHAAFPIADPALADRGDIQDMVGEAFAEAVKRQLISDVPVGSYLSGGMDSGSIVSVAGRSIPRLLTFTGGFDLTNINGIEQGFDERKLAEQLSYLLQTEHYDVVLHAGDMPAAMEKLSWHMDDPRVGMCHQNWYAAKLASRFVKVCLAGAGGDELFGGYPWRYRNGMNARSFEEFDDLYFQSWQRLLSPTEINQVFHPSLRKHIPEARESFQKVMEGAPAQQDGLSLSENMIQRALYFEFKTFLHGFLVTEDRISMAHGMETRVPFLDNDLVDLAWRIPPSLKLDTDGLQGKNLNGHIATAEGKLILRRAMESYLPKEFTQQRKQGFSPPDENWYRGPSMDYIKSILLDERTLRRPWFDQAFVRKMLEEHFSGQRNHRLLIWSLLSFEWLQRHFIDGQA
jgi:asparagine synthase (glutamine-hydrolysing)